jgi:hypothetical protein
MSLTRLLLLFFFLIRRSHSISFTRAQGCCCCCCCVPAKRRSVHASVRCGSCTRVLCCGVAAVQAVAALDDDEGAAPAATSHTSTSIAPPPAKSAPADIMGRVGRTTRPLARAHALHTRVLCDFPSHWKVPLLAQVGVQCTFTCFPLHPAGEGRSG